MGRLVSLDLSCGLGLILQLDNQIFEMLIRNLTELRELILDGVYISSQSNDMPSNVLQFLANFSSLTTLSLSGCFLQGPFPERIFQVPTLQSIDLSDNLLNGSIPQFTGSLRILLLRENDFSGSLSDSFSNVSKLSVIDLAHCCFTGPIPSMMANLTELIFVNFFGNEFTGSVPSFYMSKKLQYIDLNCNNLSGSLSTMQFKGHSSLVFLDLSCNSLNGSIPESIFGLPSLQKLFLFQNQFSGQISNLTSSDIEELDLSENQLEGPIPEYFFKLERLRYLSRSYNLFNGTVEWEKIQRLHNLERLDLSGNNLSVDVSSNNSSFSSFPYLYKLSLAFCNMYSFPDLKNQSDLYELDLSNNKITGEIPSWIWKIGDWSYKLNLSSNLLVHMEKSSDILQGFISTLDLHSNMLQGELPMLPEFADYIDFSNNNFEGSIPPNIGNSNPSFVFLSLASNRLSGVIPTSFCNASDLTILDLSFNNLSGSIPPCLVKNMATLAVLDMARNNINGDIPYEFSVHCGLQTLDLSNNNLGGNIPPSLANCKSLELLNLGNNNIHGSFPCMLSSRLCVLVLRSNRFHGEVKCNKSWPNLQIIDIASNNFSGYLYPSSFSSWRGMMRYNNTQLRPDQLQYRISELAIHYQDKVTLNTKGQELVFVKILKILTSIDFSCNNFHGEIPHAIGRLNSLYSLNLSHNSLTGTIPKSIGNLTELGSVDLSVNQLKGEIPKELAGLTFLSFLNLSYNKLVGPIPNGPQFPTFSAASFEGNTKLCGFPLNKSCYTEIPPQPQPQPPPHQKKTEIDWDYVSAALGFAVGLGGIVWLLLFCHNLRENLSEWVDRVLEKIFDRRRQGGRAVRNQVTRRN